MGANEEPFFWESVRDQVFFVGQVSLVGIGWLVWMVMSQEELERTGGFGLQLFAILLSLIAVSLLGYLAWGYLYDTRNAPPEILAG